VITTGAGTSIFEGDKTMEEGEDDKRLAGLALVKRTVRGDNVFALKYTGDGELALSTNLTDTREPTEANTE